jgi:hypothetical protein
LDTLFPSRAEGSGASALPTPAINELDADA